MAIHAIGTMLRSLLFVSFQGCYYLGALLPKDGGSGAHTKLADALNEERFYAWTQAFQRTFNVPEDVYADLKDPEEYCDIENQSELRLPISSALRWTFLLQTELIFVRRGLEISFGGSALIVENGGLE